MLTLTKRFTIMSFTFRLPDGAVFSSGDDGTITVDSAPIKGTVAKSMASPPRRTPKPPSPTPATRLAEQDRQISELSKAIAEEKQRRIDVLEQAAIDWRGRARVPGTDPGVAEYLRDKAAEAIKAADALRNSGPKRRDDLAKEAERLDRAADSAGDSELRAYYRDRARETRDELARQGQPS
jgi:hypothetical protein